MEGPLAQKGNQGSGGTDAPEFPDTFRAQLSDLLAWRRDVRRFRVDPVPEALLTRLLDETLASAPSVGLSQPTRIVRVESGPARAAALQNFRVANARALDGYEGARARLYAGLKLSGMVEAPVQLALLCDEGTEQGAGLGCASMSEMRAYSSVCAVMQLWLSARAHGIGLGWVSILDPTRLLADLDLPPDWRLIGWLCLGYPEEEHDDPELQRAGWETRRPPAILTR